MPRSLLALLAVLTMHAADPPLPPPCIAGPVHDAAVEGRLLVAVGDGVLTACDLADPLAPRPLGSLSGLGAVRQVVLRDGIAWVAAREDGLIAVDVREPARPALLTRYDTLEKATGIAIAGGLCFVACRFFGVEIIDIADPLRPRHVATAFPTLEAQSVCYADGRLYAGIWADRIVAIADLADPAAPREIGRVELDGYGDGVAVRDGILYAATGHHARAFAGGHWEAARSGEAGYGQGHGLEIWDVRDARRPGLLARHKSRPFYAGIPDMWSVEVHGATAYLTDTFNGVEAIDIADPRAPRVRLRAVLPGGEAAGGAAVGPGAIYVAGLGSGLRALADPDSSPERSAGGAPPAPAADGSRSITRDGDWWVLRPGGQVREVLPLPDGSLALAAGDAGVHLARLEAQPAWTGRIATRGPARSLAWDGGRLVVAEGWAGLSTWRLDAGGGRQVGGWTAPGLAVMQVVVPPPGRWAVVEKGIRSLAVLDLADAAGIREVAAWEGPGIFYGAQIASAPVAGRWLPWWWHTAGPYWLDLEAPGHPAPARPIAGNLHSAVTGIAVDGDAALVMSRDGLVQLRPADERDLSLLPPARLRTNAFGHRTMNGQAAAHGRHLLVSNAAWSMLRVVDVADRGAPRLLQVLRTPGNPYRPVVHAGWVLIPDGCGGLRAARSAALGLE